jgi:hypothetical protein
MDPCACRELKLFITGYANHNLPAATFAADRSLLALELQSPAKCIVSDRATVTGVLHLAAGAKTDLTCILEFCRWITPIWPSYQTASTIFELFFRSKAFATSLIAVCEWAQ